MSRTRARKIVREWMRYIAPYSDMHGVIFPTPARLTRADRCLRRWERTHLAARVAGVPRNPNPR